MSRDYGTKRLLAASEPEPAASETVMRLLDRKAEIKTRYGAAFVQSIDGIAGASSGGRRSDWFFYVNGIESSRGATEVRVNGGDRVWWDYRDWTSAMRVPAVIGSWPQPFLAGAATVAVDCRGERASCDRVAQGLRAAGARAEIEKPSAPGGSPGPRVLVGPWGVVRKDATARLIESGPARSGVFADHEGGRFVALDEGGRVAGRLSAGAGIVAALRRGEDPPTWVVSGNGGAGVSAAARLLDEATLRDRYAVATDRGTVIPLPAR